MVLVAMGQAGSARAALGLQRVGETAGAGHAMTAQEYIDKLRPTLTRHFAPGCIYSGAPGALRLGEAVGYGLGAYSDAEIKAILPTLYSDLLVRNTFTSKDCVPLSVHEWNAAIRVGIEKRRADQVWDVAERWLAAYDTEAKR